MSNLKDSHDERTPEDDDPAYENPVGKLPDPQAAGQSPVRQPFDFLASSLHTDAERREIERTLAYNALPDLRTEQMKVPLTILKAMRDSCAKMNAGARSLAEGKRNLRGRDAEYYQKTAEMYNRAVKVWTAELSLFMNELFEEMGTLLESEYPGVSDGFVEWLRAQIVS